MSEQMVEKVSTEVTVEVRLRRSETDCPKCKGVVELNSREGCYECITCGYMDCSDDHKGIPKEQVLMRTKALQKLKR